MNSFFWIRNSARDIFTLNKLLGYMIIDFNITVLADNQIVKLILYDQRHLTLVCGRNFDSFF